MEMKQVKDCMVCPFEFCGNCNHPDMPTGRKAKPAHDFTVRGDCPLIKKVQRFGYSEYYA